MTREPKPKKPRPPSITATYPGTEAVARAHDIPRDVIGRLAAVEGCPLVKGYRFTSVDAFGAWLEALPDAKKRIVPEYERIMRWNMANELAVLCWLDTEIEVPRLARKSYAELEAMLKRWREHDDTEQGRQWARAALKAAT